MTPEALTIENTDKLDFMKTKNFCASKDTVNKVKRQPTNKRKYQQIIYFDKGLILRLHIELLKFKKISKIAKGPK
jgi:hypothetical protein